MPGLHEPMSCSPPDNKLSVGSLFLGVSPEESLASSFPIYNEELLASSFQLVQEELLAASRLVSEQLLVSLFLTCGISNNLDSTEDGLNGDIIPREFGAEEDDSNIKDPFQDLDDGDPDGIAPFNDPED